jgi:predicted alpha/beta hydrolase family esterase
MNFQSKVLIHPGLGNSGERHWQSMWEMRFPDFERVRQKEWDKPVMQEWIRTLDEHVMRHDPSTVIVVGHSLACATIAFWCAEYKRKIRGALLVAPSDTEAPLYPEGTAGFKPMPANKLIFPSITVTSANDVYVAPDRARIFANRWGSDLINIGNAGHINADSNLMFWEFGLELLSRLDRATWVPGFPDAFTQR